MNAKDFVLMLFKAPTLFVFSIFKWASKIDSHKMFITCTMQEMLLVLMFVGYVTSNPIPLGIAIFACTLVVSFAVEWILTGQPKAKDDFLYCVTGKLPDGTMVQNNQNQISEVQYPEIEQTYDTGMSQIQSAPVNVSNGKVASSGINADSVSTDASEEEVVEDVSENIVIEDCTKNCTDDSSDFSNIYDLYSQAVEDNSVPESNVPVESVAEYKKDESAVVDSHTQHTNEEAKETASKKEEPVKPAITEIKTATEYKPKKVLSIDEVSNKIGKEVVMSGAEYLEIQKYMEDNGVSLGDLTDGISDDDEI